jgi:hypothetical protein
MYKVYTKNGIALFISLCDDVEPNKGGYYCEVYLDEDGITEFDNFVIHKEDLFSFENKSEGIISLCEVYANGVDDISILNKKFSTICDLIKDADAMGNDFYMRHILYNRNMDADSDLFKKMSRLQMMMAEIKALSQDVAGYYTLDK